jgi:hypothetical protein
VKILHFLLVGIHTFLHGRAADRFKGGVVHDASDRMLPTRRCQAVDHQINLAQIGLNGVDGLLLDLIAERITVDALRVQAIGPGIVMESGRVVPAGGPGFYFRAFFLKENPECGGAATKGSGDARGQAIAGGGTDHQHALGSIGNRPPALDDIYLPFDVGSATRRVSGGTNKSANAWLDNHWQIDPGEWVNVEGCTACVTLE